MNPTLTPTEAPTFFTQAFEDAEREYCVARFRGSSEHKYNSENTGGLSLFQSEEDARQCCSKRGVEFSRVIWDTLDGWFETALARGAKVVSLRDSGGKVIKRWPVDR